MAAFAAGIASSLPAEAVCADDAIAESIDHEVAILFRQLKADEQAVRVQAQSDLIDLGLSAIPGIERKVGEADLDQLPYLLAALERMFVLGCLPVADEAERALDRLTDSAQSQVAARATAVLTGHQQIRERRAVAALRELGADVLFEPVPGQQTALLMRMAPFSDPSEIVIPGHQLTKIEVWLHDDWSSGEEGLWHLTRLEHHWSVRAWGIIVYNIAGNGVSAEAVQRLAARLNKATIQERGASLGISCNPNYGCQIENVLPGGSAEQAGLGPGDEIREIDGQPIATFGHLVAELLERSAGETAVLRVARFGNEPRKIEVTLGNWRPVVAARQQAINERFQIPSNPFPERFPFAPDMREK